MSASNFRLRRQPGHVVLGPGDDAALIRVPSGRLLVASQDDLVEGTHFERAWAPPAKIASKLLGAPASEIALANGVFSAKGKSVDFRKVCSRLPGETLVATGDRAKDYDGTDTRLFGAQFAEVVVDVETGVVGVKKVVAVHDCGQPVWKTGVESQIRGGGGGCDAAGAAQGSRVA